MGRDSKNHTPTLDIEPLFMIRFKKPLQNAPKKLIDFLVVVPINYP